MEQLECVSNGMEPRDMFAIEAMKVLMCKHPEMYGDFAGFAASSIPLGSLNLSARAHNAIEFSGVNTISKLCNLSERDLLGLRAFGRTSLREVKKALQDRGLYLRSNEPIKPVNTNNLGAVAYAIADEMMAARGNQ